MKSTWFNLTGFVQPATVVEMCNCKDDSLMDRQWTIFIKTILNDAHRSKIYKKCTEFREAKYMPCLLKEVFKESKTSFSLLPSLRSVTEFEIRA